MTGAISTAAVRPLSFLAGVAVAITVWLWAANGARAGTYVIDDFESGAPVYLTVPKGGYNRTIQTALPVFSGVRAVGVSGGDTTASWGRAELVSTLGDDGMRFTGADGNSRGVTAGVTYRSQTDWYHGVDFDALAVADRFYVKLGEERGAGIGFDFILQDQDGYYLYGGVTLDGSGYLELPFAAFDQDEPFPMHPDFHHVSAFGFQVAFFSAATQSVTVTEFGITGVPEPASAVLLGAGGLVMLLRHRRRL